EDKKEKARAKRAPLPKLDADRLLGEDGLRKLLMKSHELVIDKREDPEKNLRNLMTFYQIWAHEMFPSMKFRDVIAKTEKICKEERLKSRKQNRNGSGIVLQSDRIKGRTEAWKSHMWTILPTRCVFR
ncbi:17212_t:CDS:2, partial [Cetraspora pellucida]